MCLTRWFVRADPWWVESAALCLKVAADETADVVANRRYVNQGDVSLSQYVRYLRMFRAEWFACILGISKGTM